MWYKNKKTGLIWEITDKELIKKLEKDNNYEVVKAPTSKKNEPEKIGEK